MELAIEPEDEGRAPITLLFVCPVAHEMGQLRARLECIADRYGALVDLQVVRPADVPAPYRTRSSLPGPTVLVLRRGEIVGEAMGATLPARELDRVVRCAVEWPDPM